jgi:hypothetical protein
MGRIGNSTWAGKSGIIYDFVDYDLNISFEDDAKGNYIFSKEIMREGKLSLTPVYIGEGVIRERIEYRINEGRIQMKGCSCVSIRRLNKGEDSKQIEEDLLAAHPSSYEPTGCNIKQGG